MRYLLILIFASVVLFSNGQSSSNWYKQKYGISTLSELGEEKLNVERVRFERNRNIGIGLTVGGVGLFIGGIAIALDESWYEEDPSTGAGDIIALIGVGAFFSGICMWGTNGSRHNQIVKTLKTLNVKIESGSSLQGGNFGRSSYQVGVTIYF